MLSWVCEFRFQGLPTCVARFANLCCNAMDGRRRVSRPVALRTSRLTRPKRGLGQRAQRAVQFGPTLRASSREVMGVPVPRCTHAQGYRYFCFLSLLSHNGRIATGRAVGYAQREDDVPVALQRPRQRPRVPPHLSWGCQFPCAPMLRCELHGLRRGVRCDMRYAK